MVLKDKQMSTITGLLGFWWNVINGFLCGLGGLGFELTPKGQPLLCWQEVLTSQSQYPTLSTQVILPFSHQCPMISPQLLCCCATLPSCSWKPMKKNTNVWSPNVHSTPPDVEFESVKYPPHRHLGTNLVFTHWLRLQQDNVADAWKCIWDN